MTDTISIRDDISPSAQEAIALYVSVGWGKVEDYSVNQWQDGLAKARLVTAYDGQSLVGIARVITDGFHDTYITEIAVKKEYQKSGIGRRIMSKISDIYGSTSIYSIGASSAQGFFSACGLKARPHMSVFSIAPTK